MSQIWKEDKVIPVTLVKVDPQTVTLVRTKERDGYAALQVASGKKKKEFRMRGGEAPLKKGDALGVDSLKENDLVRVSGVSKGRGFQGVVKRHGFGGGPKTHGQKNRLRAPGSIGNTSPQRVIPGRRMAGRMGSDRITIKRFKVVRVDKDKNILFLKGALPGARDGFLEISKVLK